MTGRVFTLISTLAVLVALAVAGTAFAQSTPAQTVYNPGGEVLGVVNGGGPADIVPAPATSNGGGGTAPAPATRRESGGGTPTTPAATGSLPFTGFQAGLVALLGLGLLGGGIAMRRVAGSDS